VLICSNTIPQTSNSARHVHKPLPSFIPVVALHAVLLLCLYACLNQGAAFTATVFNLVNVIMGAGYVSIPFACRQVINRDPRGWRWGC